MHGVLPLGMAAALLHPLPIAQAAVPTTEVGQTYEWSVTLSKSRAHRPFVVKWRAPGARWQATQRGRVGGLGRVRVSHVPDAPGLYRMKIRLPRHERRPAHVTRVRKLRALEPASPPVVEPSPTPTPSGPESFTAYAVGDIGYEGGQAAATAALLPDAAIALVTGDLAYPAGTASQFADYYLPAYGRLVDTTYPVPGNHDYGTTAATPYFDLFGTRVGTPEQPWYSWQRGAWVFYHLNSNCSSVGGCDPASPQYRWLEQQLAVNQQRCIAVAWHHPRWSASRHGHTTAVADLYGLLAASGADLLLTGHEHNYQRFDRLAPDGTSSPGGIREFVTGAGGAPLYSVGSAVPAPQAWDDAHHGVMELQFGADGYAWRFLTTGGEVTDSGTDTC